MNLEIIGAGVAGGFAALNLAKQGHNVIVYDIKPRVIPALCGEGIWSSLLTRVGIKGDKKYVLNATKKLKIGLEIRGELRFLYKQTREPYLTLNRQVLEELFLKKAKKYGTTIRFAEYKKSFDKSVDFKVGAWGTNPISPYNKIFSRYQFGYQFLMDGIDIENCKTLVLKNDVGIRYFWIFPRGKNKANVGVMTSIDFKNPRKTLLEFVASDKELRDGEIVREFGKKMNANPPVRKEWLEKCTLLVGDAGGFCNTISGGGIGNALLSAKICAESIDEEQPIEAFFEKTSELRAKCERAYNVYDKFYSDNRRVEKLYDRIRNEKNLGSISEIACREWG
jgi:flavin-dependent dehydrogenase